MMGKEEAKNPHTHTPRGMADGLALPTVEGALAASAKRTWDMFHATHQETLPVFPQA